MPETDFDKLFQQFSSIKTGVIGDVMLDTYWWGHVDRISPEAPVPIVALDKKEYRIGGAGNVALNLASLGARVTVLSTIGEDENGVTLKKNVRRAPDQHGFSCDVVIENYHEQIQDHFAKPADDAARCRDHKGPCPRRRG